MESSLCVSQFRHLIFFSGEGWEEVRRVIKLTDSFVQLLCAIRIIIISLICCSSSLSKSDE